MIVEVVAGSTTFFKAAMEFALAPANCTWHHR